MSTQAYGSITIVDIGDLGELSVTPESNQPTMVVYSPDNQTYNPDWSGNPNLIITPVVYYGNQKLLDGSSASIPSGLTVTWKYQVGNGSIIDINPNSPPSGHSVLSTGKLQVSTNQLSTANPLLTYIVEVTYVDSTIGLTSNNPLVASGQITYGLIQNASTLKMINVTGAGAFLYNSSNQCNNSPIVLTATATGVSVAKWQYKNNLNNWVDISGATSSTLSVAESTSAYFVQDVAVFRAIDSSGTVYDEHSIVKLRDGAPGDSIDSAVLSNEDQMVPCDKDGNPITGAFAECTTTLTIYEGNTATYDGWTITVNQQHGVTGTWNSTNHTFSASGISANTGYVTFTCTKDGHNTLIKTFSLVKVKAGADGTNGTSPTIYSLEVDSLAVNKTIVGVPTPSSIHLNAYTQTGNAAKTAYSGLFKVYKDGASAAAASSSGSSWTYNIASSSTDTIKQLKFELYNSAGSTLYDTQTVVITTDGQTGATGAGGLNFVLGNYSDQIPCNVSGNVIGSSDIVKNIPFAAYEGATKVGYCSATVSGTVSNKITASVTAQSGSTNGNIAVTFKAGTDLGGTSQGTLTITLTAKTASNGTTLGTQTFTYTWVKNTQGESAVLFQLYTPNGNIVSNNDNAITITPMLIEGALDKTTSGSYRWYKYANGTYDTEITSSTSTDPIYKSGNNLIINPSGVDSYLSIKCVATYTPTGATSAATFTAYQSVYDKTDIFQITVLSTLGDKLVNSVGTGIIYTKVLRNGEPYDEIKSTAVATSNSAAAFNTAVSQQGVSGADPTNYCWYATSTSLSLYRKSGTSWSAVSSSSDPHIATYSWTGLHISDNTNATIYGYGKNKAILLNGAIVNKKTMFNVTMTVT